MGEVKTAKRIAQERKAVDFEVYKGIDKTCIVTIMGSGDVPVVMMWADMDGFPVKENSGLSCASNSEQDVPIMNELRPIMQVV